MSTVQMKTITYLYTHQSKMDFKFLILFFVALFTIGEGEFLQSHKSVDF